MRKNLKVTIYSFFILIFLFLTFGLLNNFVFIVRERAIKKFIIVENYVSSAFKASEQILTGIALASANEEINHENRRLQNYIKSFDSKIDRYSFVSFSGFKLLDAANNVVYHTLVPEKIFTPMKALADLTLVEKAKKLPYKTHFASIRLGILSQELIVPACIGIKNKKNKYGGTLCACLSVKMLSKNLDAFIRERNIYNVELLPLETNENNGNRMIETLTITNIIFAALKGESLVFYEPLTKYPAILKAEVDSNFLFIKIFKILLFLLSYILVAFFLGAFMLYFEQQNYKLFLTKIIDKINLTESVFQRQDLNTNNKKPCLDLLAKKITRVIDYCEQLHFERQKQEKEKIAKNFRKEVFDLILTAHHYDKVNHKIISPSELYLNKLDSLCNDEETEINIKSFLYKVAEYCADYFEEIKLDFEFGNHDPELFLSKEDILAETFFAIFSAITRIGKFDTDEKIIIKTKVNENNMPIFTIETKITDAFCRPSGWEQGASLVYGGLFPIFLLAKVNNFYFYIEQVDEKLLFRLMPLQDKLKKTANELCSKLEF